MVDSNSTSDRTQAEVRIACKKLRAKINTKTRTRLSEKITTKIVASDVFLYANNIAVFVPMKTEVNIWPLIQRAWQLKKRIFAPIVQENSSLTFRHFADEDELSTNKMGLREPIDGELIQADELDLVLVPLVAFDSNQNRIGMGGGFYDRTFSFLEQTSSMSKPKLVGVAFECQRIERITPNPWDIRLFSVVTESG